MFGKKMISLEKMRDIEKWIEDFWIPNIGQDLSDRDLSDKFRLKVEYVNQKEIQKHTEAELAPIKDDRYYGVIRINDKYNTKFFSYMHEIIHYVRDVGIGNRVEEVHTRKTRGHIKSLHEQETDFIAAAVTMPYSKVKKAILLYDKSTPKMDELEFVDKMCKEFNQDRTAVVRRIQEVRRCYKAHIQ